MGKSEEDLNLRYKCTWINYYGFWCFGKNNLGFSFILGVIYVAKNFMKRHCSEGM